VKHKSSDKTKNNHDIYSYFFVNIHQDHNRYY